LEIKINKAKELLQEGYSVRFVLKLKGRENIFKQQSKEKLKQIAEQLKEY